MSGCLRAPVALLIFNRPDLTHRVVAEILRARPPKVLVFADGPRTDHPGDVELVAATRAIIGQARWECDVMTNYSETNLGTRYRPATGLDWVFANVDEAIFFEDDCLPHSGFFRFCDELLERYREDERVMMISGNNFMPERVTPDSYLFSRYVGIWGWATWKRAWKHYDVDLHLWRELRDTEFLRHVLGSDGEVQLWRNYFDRIVSGESQTWDHQWQFACWAQHGLSIMPATNLVSNMGFDPRAQHYREFNAKLANVPASEPEFPLRHPQIVVRNRDADEFVARELHGSLR